MDFNPTAFVFASNHFAPCKPSRGISCQTTKRCRKYNSPFVVACEGPRRNEAIPLLEMRDMTYRVPYNLDKYLFTDMNFKVYDGEFVVVIGENGAGKSTALNLMIGFSRVDRGKGQLFWKGEKTRPSGMIKNIGVVMQNPADYFLTPTVLDELVLGRKTKTPDDVRRVLAAVGLTNVSLMASPKSLSGGQVRRLALASQLMRDPLPSLFVLDEPLAGVDWTARRDLIALLSSLKSQFAIIIVSHEPGDLLQYADRVVEVSRQGMYDVDPQIIEKAIAVRAELAAQKRAKDMAAARQYQARTRSENLMS